MSYSNKVLTCQQCGRRFTFTADEQVFYARKGISDDPTCCPACRSQRGTSREMFSAICSTCGKATQISPVPRANKRVYCPECLQQRSGGRHV